MLRRLLVPALVAGLGLAALAVRPTAADDKLARGEIAKLVEQLGSGNFDEREKASAALDKIGEPALDALRQAAKSDDAEVRRRAEELVKKIEKRAESAAVLVPKKVHLVYKDTPLPDAVKDFATKSGYTITLLDPENKLAGRKVTLDTGAVTFWQAFDQFCEKAGLVEVPAAPGVMPVMPPVRNVLPGRIQIQPLRIQPIRIQRVPPPAPPKPDDKPLDKKPADKPAEKPADKDEKAAEDEKPQPVPRPAAARRAQAAPAQPPAKGRPQVVEAALTDAVSAGQIVLADGKFEKRPTDSATAVRVRATANPAQFFGAADGRLLLGLEATPEPRIVWQALVGVKVEKAVDDQGQELAQDADPNAVRPSYGPQFPVYLKKGEKPTKSLKEVKGTVTAQVLTPPKPTITCDNILKAAGQTFKGADGGFIKVLEVKAGEKGGPVTVRFELEAPPNVIPPGQFGGVNGAFPAAPIKLLPLPAPPVPVPVDKQPAAAAALQLNFVAQAAPPQGQVQPAQLQVQFARVQIGDFGGAPGITLEDAKGNAFRLTGSNVRSRFDGQKATTLYTLTFEPAKDQGEPAKLVFSGSRSVTIDIPFTLKDVPLP